MKMTTDQWPMTTDQQGRFLMNTYTIFLALSLFLFSMNGTSLGAEVAKIGVIDFQRIIDESNAGKRSAVEIKSQGKKMEKTLSENQRDQMKGTSKSIKKILRSIRKKGN